MVFYSDSFVVCEGIQLKFGTVHFIRIVQGTIYPKFSYLAVAVYELSALANHRPFSSVENSKNYQVFDSESFVFWKVI